MYFPKDKQISLFEFGQKAGITLDPNNRWVQMSNLIDWDLLEQKYSKLFCENNGRPAHLVQTGIAALIIKQLECLSDEKLVIHIQENPYMQYFCGIKEYSYDEPFCPQEMLVFRKRFNDEIINEVNEMIFKPKKDDNDDDDKPNRGTVLLDATCAPADVAYPQDINLVNEAREKTEKMVEVMHSSNKGICEKPRLDKQKARREYLKVAKSKKRSRKTIRKAVKKQLSFVKRNLGYIEKLIADGHYDYLSNKQKSELETIKTLYTQQKEMIDENKNSVADRIVSISQPHIRPIVRGKAKATVEFGAKVAISVTEGYAFVDKISWDAYNESTDLQGVIHKYRADFGCYPEAVMVDKIYRTQDNIKFCNSHGIRITGPKLGRPKKGEIVDKRQEYIDAGVRNAVEGKFGTSKTSYGLGRIKAKLKTTAETVISLAFLVMNLQKKLALLLWQFLAFWRFEKIWGC